jgi:HTH-type transcriptional regulator / antitoxin HigA
MASEQQAGIPFTPNAVHPGEIVSEYVEFHGWTQRDLARRTGLTPKTISEICNGKAPLTPTTALALEKVLRRPAHFWLNLQRQHDEAEARNRELRRSALWTDWARKFPLKDMKRLQFSLPAGRSDVDALLTFLGVSSPESWDAVWSASNVAYRQTRKFAQSTEAISAWVRETELTAEQMETAPFDEARLRASIGELRRLTRQKADSILNPVQSICAGFGVAVVLVPELPHCGISGSAQWLSDKKALIGLTLRYKTDDQLWFTFFHELGHILLHRKKKTLIVDNAADDLSDRIIDPEMQGYEAEANQFSADTLIPPAALSEFLRARYSARDIASDAIHDFAEAVGVGPGIVVGRLQHDGILKGFEGNTLKQRLNWHFGEGA